MALFSFLLNITRLRDVIIFLIQKKEKDNRGLGLLSIVNIKAFRKGNTYVLMDIISIGYW